MSIAEKVKFLRDCGFIVYEEFHGIFVKHSLHQDYLYPKHWFENDASLTDIIAKMTKCYVEYGSKGREKQVKAIRLLKEGLYDEG